LLLAARHEADRLLTMINDLLDLTRIEQGRLRLDLQPVAPRELIDEGIERAGAQARARGITFETDVASQLPAVWADRERVGHVFDNLVANALRHSERGGHVRLTARATDDSVRFTVQDHGEGIPAEFLPHIFEKFYRVLGARHGGGAGLGLAIVREIVSAHNGQIDVTSQPGVEVRLPARSEKIS
jgi:signal transduction histidine kinase